MSISQQTYERVALEDPDGLWELVCGRLRSKPAMTTEHEGVMWSLTRHLVIQLDERAFRVGMNSPRLRISSGTYYLPDVCVVPRASELRLREIPGRVALYEEPMPLVVEVWSPSTGEYDVEEKLREYQWRGDLEIWRIHPYERTIIAWRRQPDGSYIESRYQGGTVQPVALPNVTIEIEALFD
ncbi:MAG: Uma2 family endonuclease [Dehalococcoidia bacterium]